MPSDDSLYFESSEAAISTTYFTKPMDDFSTPPLLPNIIFYLATISPHTDSYTLHGPFREFTHLLPKIEEVVSNSPKAIDKLSALRSIEDVWGDVEENRDFKEKGFQTLVVEGQRGIYTVLKVLREENAAVCFELPSPVYTITSHGPLTHAISSASCTSFKLGSKGYAATTRLIGTFVERREAKAAAQQAMQDMTAGLEGVKVSENWESGGKGGGVLMAMSPLQTWEVRVVYEDQVLKRAREGLERDGGSAGWRF